MNEQNINFIQQLRERVESGGSPKIWFLIGVGVSIVFCGAVIIQQYCHRKRASLKIERVIAQLDGTEDGHDLERGVVNKRHALVNFELPSHARTTNM